MMLTGREPAGVTAEQIETIEEAESLGFQMSLWKVSVKRDADWNRPANEAVVGISRKLTKKFPYRG